MEYFYDKKKVFTRFLVSLISFGAAVSSIIFIFNNIDNDNFSPFIPISLIVLFPAAIIACIYSLMYASQFIKSDNALIRMDEHGIFLNTNTKYRKIGFIRWNEISKIELSTDNMNKPAVRIILSGHINSEYMFYVTIKDVKKIGISVKELYDAMIVQFNANRR